MKFNERQIVAIGILGGLLLLSIIFPFNRLHSLYYIGHTDYGNRYWGGHIDFGMMILLWIAIILLCARAVLVLKTGGHTEKVNWHKGLKKLIIIPTILMFFIGIPVGRIIYDKCIMDYIHSEISIKIPRYRFWEGLLQLTNASNYQKNSMEPLVFSAVAVSDFSKDLVRLKIEVPTNYGTREVKYSNQTEEWFWPLDKTEETKTKFGTYSPPEMKIDIDSKLSEALNDEYYERTNWKSEYYHELYTTSPWDENFFALINSCPDITGQYKMLLSYRDKAKQNATKSLGKLNRYDKTHFYIMSAIFGAIITPIAFYFCLRFILFAVFKVLIRLLDKLIIRLFAVFERE